MSTVVTVTSAALAGGAFASATLSAVLAVFAIRRRPRPGATPFAFVLGTVSVWIALYGIAIISDTQATIRTSVTGIQLLQTLLPVAWLVFAFEYAGRSDEMTTRRTALLSVPLAVSAVVILFDPGFISHSRVDVIERGGLLLPEQQLTAFGAAVVLYAYGLIVWSFVVLLKLLLGSSMYHRRQVVLVVVATLLPSLTAAVYLAGVGPISHLDLTPYGVAIEGIILFYALFGVRLFDVTPVARAEVLETLDSAVIVVDDEDRVVDANPSARVLAAVGAPARHTFAEAFPDVVPAIAAGKKTVAVTVEGDRRSYAIRESAFAGRGQHGRVLVLTDVTDRLERERALETLSIAASDLMEADSREEICERTVQAATDFLSLPFCTVRLLEGDELVPAASTRDAVELYEAVGESVPSFAVGEGVIGTAFAQEAPIGYEDVRQAPMLSDPETPYRCVMVFPLSGHGTLTVGSPEPVAVDEETRYFAGILAANVTYALDRTAREAELELQNERLDEFASVVSHDLRNPLAVAEAFLDFAREEHGEDESFDRIEVSLTRIGVIAGDLLAMARTGSPADRVPVLLSGVAERAWENVVTHDADLVLAVDDYEVRAVPNRLQQALENLFRNAIEHGFGDARDAQPAIGTTDAVAADGSEGGDAAASVDVAANVEVVANVDTGTTAAGSGFTVTVGRLADDTGFFIADNGPGISADLRDRVFERGVSGRNGTGLGLAIVQSVANEHDWAVDATDSDTGGARFEFRV